MAWCLQAKSQGITWANVHPDLCRHMVSLGHNELNELQYYTFKKLLPHLPRANQVSQCLTLLSFFLPESVSWAAVRLHQTQTQAWYGRTAAYTPGWTNWGGGHWAVGSHHGPSCPSWLDWARYSHVQRVKEKSLLCTLEILEVCVQQNSLKKPPHEGGLSSLHVKFFSRNINMYVTISIIPSHWHDISC